MRFKFTYSFGIETYTPIVPSKTIPDFRPKWAKFIPVFRPKGAKTLPFGAAHTYMAYIRGTPPRGSASSCYLRM